MQLLILIQDTCCVYPLSLYLIKNKKNMKRIIIITSFLLAGLSFVNAQTTPAKVTVKTSKATAKKSDKMAADTTKKVTTKATMIKKDGTPDMRMKQNKMAVKTETSAGPKKKDGTADMRYKANKKK